MANPARVDVAKAVKAKDRDVCPECGKDIHSPECPYYSKRRR